jgi:hypothetical protein
MANEILLGQLVPHDELDIRDAIHIAVATVKAGEFLSPGQRVGLIGPGIAGTGVEAIGIVDPFLTESVLEGERFHMCLFPYTITSLRHQWTHPAFEAAEIKPPKPVEREETEEYQESKRWLEDYADNLGVSYDELMAHVEEFVEHGEYWNEGPRFEGDHAPDELFDHYGIVKGARVPGNARGGLFSCSC